MGIDKMGDIISILRHSKTVTDQSVRDKILAENAPKIMPKIIKLPVSSSVSSTIGELWNFQSPLDVC
jgi:hypothetical protein